jgi:hypothetical protein
MIIYTNPKEIATETATVLVYSDAVSNIDAIKEIDAWARERGFVRTREGHLNVALRGGKQVYKGVCFRLEEEDVEAAKVSIERNKRRLEEMPMTRSSSELLREGD